MDEQKLIHDPSQKVLAMYQAVIEFINEGCDINTLKVADITGRAGCGPRPPKTGSRPGSQKSAPDAPPGQTGSCNRR